MAVTLWAVVRLDLSSRFTSPEELNYCPPKPEGKRNSKTYVKVRRNKSKGAVIQFLLLLRQTIGAVSRTVAHNGRGLMQLRIV